MRFILGVLIIVAMLPALAASSETIVPPSDPQTMRCEALLESHIFIAQVIAGGTKRGNFELFVKSLTQLTQEQKNDFLILMNEAYSAKDMAEWLNGYWLPCMKQEEV